MAVVSRLARPGTWSPPGCRFCCPGTPLPLTSSAMPFRSRSTKRSARPVVGQQRNPLVAQRHAVTGRGHRSPHRHAVEVGRLGPGEGDPREGPAGAGNARGLPLESVARGNLVIDVRADDRRHAGGDELVGQVAAVGGRGQEGPADRVRHGRPVNLLDVADRAVAVGRIGQIADRGRPRAGDEQRPLPVDHQLAVDGHQLRRQVDRELLDQHPVAGGPHGQRRRGHLNGIGNPLGHHVGGRRRARAFCVPGGSPGSNGM